jgi:adenylate cyclase
MQRLAQRLLQPILAFGSAQDSAEERLRKQTLAATAAMILIVAPFYVLIYLLLQRPLAAAIPGLYWLASLVGLLHFARSGRYQLFRLQQVAMMLVLPFVLQWTLGGFVNSSAVSIYGFIAPVGALIWYGPRQALPWFGGFLLLTVTSALIDPAIAATASPLPAPLQLLFFVLNIASLAAITYLVLQFFVRGREAAQAESERLLHNVLPQSIADRLRAGEGVIADDHPAVTVVFADVAGFTALARRAEAGEVIRILDAVFTAFDELAERHGLEKIKTIGDAYMAVAGAPVARPDHAQAAADMALAMMDEISRVGGRVGHELVLRIGLHSGPVAAGVIGRRKFAYDLWGDAVNVASRMELHGVPGRIQVSEAAAERLRDGYELEERGTIEVKGLGQMSTFFLLGRRSGYAPGGE